MTEQERFAPPERHRALDAIRSGSDRLVHRISEALGDADEPIVVGSGARGTSFDRLLELIDGALRECEEPPNES